MAQRKINPHLGSRRGQYDTTRNFTSGWFQVEEKACEVRQGRTLSKGNGDFSANAEGRNDTNKSAFVSVLNSCSALRALEEGRRVHKQITLRGCESDLYVGSSLVDVYAKCGSIDDAWRVFRKMPRRNVVSWTAMIRGWMKCGQGQKAIELYLANAKGRGGPRPCHSCGCDECMCQYSTLVEGRHVHEQILQKGYECDIVLGNSTIDMYAECGSLEDAWRVFRKMPRRDVVSCSAMIQGCVKCGQGQQALELFRQMQQERVTPDPVTFVGVLNACASITSLEDTGRHVHEEIIRCGSESDVFVGSSLIDMHSKCGSIEDARRVFSAMPTRNVVSWNAMLRGYEMHGNVKEAFVILEQMCQEGVEMNGVTLVSLLSACSHVVDEGLHYFESTCGSCVGYQPERKRKMKRSEGGLHSLANTLEFFIVCVWSISTYGRPLTKCKFRVLNICRLHGKQTLTCIACAIWEEFEYYLFGLP